MAVRVYPNPKKLSEAAAQFFVETAREAVQKRGKFTAALSGGSSPRPMYELLASKPYKKQVPWQQTFVFWGDERFVSPDDPENNARMARQTLLDHVPIPAGHIFPIPTDGEPKEAAARYAATLATLFGDRERPRFDLMLLGLGKNGHTASLFPGTDVLDEQKKWVASVYLEEPNQYRITLTAPVINNARHIVFLALGNSKATVLQEALEGRHKPEELPAQLVDPAHGDLRWLVDEKAAAHLNRQDT